MNHANYGIDAPNVVLRFLLMGALGLLLGLICLYPMRHVIPPGLASGVGTALLWTGGTFVVIAVVMICGSKIVKPHITDQLVNSLSLRGDERVLDVGCGHGLMLITAAKRLKTGRATGVDIWQKEDQAGNSPEATLENIRVEEVADRVELKDGDARRLPFEDESFDTVVSSWALHNIYDKEGRVKAVREIIRVLKPGGRVALIDIQHTQEYAQIFRQSGMEDVKRSGPNLVFVIPSYSLTARKSRPENKC